MVGDIFEIYFNEHVQKMKGSQDDIKLVEDEYLYKICELVSKYGEKNRVASLLQIVAATCVSQPFTQYNSAICAIVGSIYFEKQFYSKAYTFYLRADDLVNAIKALREVMQSGYKGEQDLFVARLCFEVLIRNYKDKSGLTKIEMITNSF